LSALTLDHVNQVAASWLSAPRTVASVGPSEPET
jgi:hypothetical protein